MEKYAVLFNTEGGYVTGIVHGGNFILTPVAGISVVEVMADSDDEAERLAIPQFEEMVRDAADEDLAEMRRDQILAQQEMEDFAHDNDPGDYDQFEGRDE